MNVLAICDLHNDIENMLTYLDKLSKLDFDAIVAPGDFIDNILPRGMTQADIAELIIEELSSLGKPVLAVPGNMDKSILEILEKHDMSIHGKGKIVKGVGFYGMGGAATPFGTPLEPTEAELQKGLETGLQMVKDCEMKVQVTHNPPAGTKLDTISSGAHVGSLVVRKFIENVKPNAAVSAHIHEARGVDQIGSTTIVNPGRFPEGYCGIISIEKSQTFAKIINLI
jgi:Icc-related predicted phosphoesterase